MAGLLIFTEIRAVHFAELNLAMGIVIAGLSQFHGRARARSRVSVTREMWLLLNSFFEIALSQSKTGGELS